MSEPIEHIWNVDRCPCDYCVTIRVRARIANLRRGREREVEQMLRRWYARWTVLDLAALGELDSPFRMR